MKSPVIITGFPRSGTTLARAVVGAHPSIELVNESELLHSALRANYDAASRVSAGAREALLCDLESSALTRRHLAALPEGARAAYLSAPGDLDIRAVYELLLPRSREAPVWGEKSLTALSWVDRILELYPDAFFLAMVRDPRAAVRSKLVKDRARQAGERTTEGEKRALDPWSEWPACARLAMSWQDAAEIVSSLSRRLGSDRFMVCRFEDLVASAGAFSRRVCAAIGVDHDATMLDPAARANDPVLARRGAFAHGRVATEVDATRASAHLDLHPALTAIIEKLAAEGMRHLGYEPTRAARTLFDRLRYGARLSRNRGRLQKARIVDRANRFPGWDFAGSREDHSS